MNRSVSFAATIAAALCLSGCAKDPPPLTSTPVVTVLDANELPSPAQATQGAQLGALDTVRIDVFGVEALDREIQVDASGRISFPFVGSLSVAGKMPAEVAEMIGAGLRQGYVKDPVVTVNLVDSQSQTFAVEGEVEKPGTYPAAGELTLLSAIAVAGGANDYALREQVVIFRELDGARYAGVYNLNSIRRGLIPDPRVFAHDTVVIGESPRRKAIDRAITVAPAFTSPLILLLTRL